MTSVCYLGPQCMLFQHNKINSKMLKYTFALLSSQSGRQPVKPKYQMYSTFTAKTASSFICEMHKFVWKRNLHDLYSFIKRAQNYTNEKPNTNFFLNSSKQHFHTFFKTVQYPLAMHRWQMLSGWYSKLDMFTQSLISNYLKISIQQICRWLNWKQLIQLHLCSIT